MQQWAFLLRGGLRSPKESWPFRRLWPLTQNRLPINICRTNEWMNFTWIEHGSFVLSTLPFHFSDLAESVLKPWRTVSSGSHPTVSSGASHLSTQHHPRPVRLCLLNEKKAVCMNRKRWYHVTGFLLPPTNLTLDLLLCLFPTQSTSDRNKQTNKNLWGTNSHGREGRVTHRLNVREGPGSSYGCFWLNR